MFKGDFMKLLKYDILLKKNSRKLIPRIIQWVTKDKYSHSQIYIGDYHIIDGNPQGVKVRNFDSSLCEFDCFRYYRDLTDEEQSDIEEFLQKSINSKYDFIELIYQLFNKEKEQDKKYICISLLMSAFRYAGIEVDSWRQGFKQVSDSKYFYKVN